MAIVGNRNSKMANVEVLKTGVKKYSNTRLNILSRDIVDTALKAPCGYFFIVVPRLNADLFSRTECWIGSFVHFDIRSMSLIWLVLLYMDG